MGCYEYESRPFKRKLESWRYDISWQRAGEQRAEKRGAGRFDNTCANRLMVVEAIKGRGRPRCAEKSIEGA
jgi:hypothetical protein